MVYIYTLSKLYFVIFRLNECILQFKRLSNNMNAVFDITNSIFKTLIDYSFWRDDFDKLFLCDRFRGSEIIV